MATKAKIAQTVKAEMNNETVVGINADEIKTEEESTGKRLGIVSKLWSNKTVVAIGSVYVKTWYMGLGAAIVLEKKGVDVISGLIATGEAFEHNAREQAIETVDKTVNGVKATAEDAKVKAHSKLHEFTQELDENINKTLHRLKVPTANDIEDLSKLVGEVSVSVASLMSEIKAKSGKESKAGKAA